MKYKTKGNSHPQGKPRVYFTGHPKDCIMYFDSISADILALCDCAVFYDENPEQPEDQENFFSDLDRMQLIVVVVTGKYVYQDTFAHETVFQYAVKHHIPVLPILEETGNGIEQRFNEKCGDLQYLNPNTKDVTEISYKDKLKKFLDSVLVGDVLAAQIRAAFDTYVFLSYRKKDRKYAQELMRLIHSNDFCRDIAIWYDEFLVPGENFNDAIRKAMENSSLFALAVTPSLLEEPNYVMDKEYPEALDCPKEILPVSLVPTDKDKLAERFRNIPKIIDSADTKALSAALKNVINNIGTPEKHDDPEHIFFIGLAYLGGVDVEVDFQRAVELITSAAEHELPEAMQKLVSMYRVGEGVERSYETAIEWQRKLVGFFERKYDEEPSEDRGLSWLASLRDLGGYLREIGHLKEAIGVYKEMTGVGEMIDETCVNDRVKRAASRSISYGYNMIGIIYGELGDILGADEHIRKGLEIRNRLRDQMYSRGEIPVKDVIREQRVVAVQMFNLGKIWFKHMHFKQAKKLAEDAIRFMKAIPEGLYSDSEWDALRACYVLYGDIWKELGDYARAEVYYAESHDIAQDLAERIDSVGTQCEAVTGCQCLGDIYKEQSDFPKAHEYYEKSLTKSLQLAEQHDSFDVQHVLAISYGRLGGLYFALHDYETARDYFEKGKNITKRIAEQTDSVDVWRDLSECYRQLTAVCSCQEGGILDATEYGEKAYDILARLAEETKMNSAEVQLALSYCENDLGRIYEEQGNLSKARKYHEDSLKIVRQLAAQPNAPEARQMDMLICYEELGRICAKLKDFSGAKENYENYLEIKKCLAREMTTVDDARENAAIMIELGKANHELGNLPEAIKKYFEATGIKRQIAKHTKLFKDWMNAADSYYELGDMYCEYGDLISAKENYGRSLRLRTKLEYTGDSQVRNGIAVSCLAMARTAESEPERIHYLDECEEIWQQLVRQYPDVALYREHLALVRSMR